MPELIVSCANRFVVMCKTSILNSKTIVLVIMRILPNTRGNALPSSPQRSHCNRLKLTSNPPSNVGYIYDVFTGDVACVYHFLSSPLIGQSFVRGDDKFCWGAKNSEKMIVLAHASFCSDDKNTENAE